MNFNQQKLNQNDFGASLDGTDQQQNASQQNQMGQQQMQGYQQMDPNQQYQQQYLQQQQMQGYGQMDPNQYQMMMMQQQQQQMMHQQQFGGYQQLGQQFGGMGMDQQHMQMNMMQQNQGFGYQGQINQNVPVQQNFQAQQLPVVTPITQAPVDAKPDDSLSKVFNAGSVAEFVPKGQVAYTKEQFMGLDELDEDENTGGKKKKKNKGKKGGVAATTAAAVDDAVDETTAWKGKPSKFFQMEVDNEQPADPSNPGNFKMTDEQWHFVFKYYPEYGAGPYDLFVWIYNQVLQSEQAEQDNYGAPRVGGRTAGQNDEPQSIDDVLSNAAKSGADKGFGGKTGGKQLNKAQQQKLDQQKKEEEKARIQQRKDELAKSGAPQKTDEQKKEELLLKKFKDKVVNMNPDDCIEVDTVREPASMVFIGHVDAGKSTICGNLLFLTNVVDQRTIEKYKQEAKDKGRDSWWLAYVMDSNDEEKAKGKTVEVGRAQFDTTSKKYTIFDAPGHKNYVPNMIMGAACADVAGLVISARKGEFEAGFEADGQSREHAQLAKSLGVQKLVVVINKMDDCRWSKERYDQIVKDLAPFLKATGYKDEDITYLPISGLTSENIATKVDPKVCNWYSGPTLLEVIDTVQLMPRYPAGPLRLPILDKWKEKDLIAFGKVENGTLRLGDKLAIMPSGVPAQVLSLLDAKGQVVKYATPGENVSVTLNVADEDQVQRGFVLCQRESMMPVTDVFEAELDILDLLDYKPIISKGYHCMMHIHTHAGEVTISHIVKSFETNDRGEVTEKQKPQFARSQTKIICRMSPTNPVSLEKFETIQQMGRFTLRDDGKTICVGKVLKYKPYNKSASAAQGQVAALAKKLDSTQITSSSEPVKGEVVMNLETGEVKEKAKPLGAIAEGEEEAD